MPRIRQTPAQTVALTMDGLIRSISKLLIENPNFQSQDGRTQAHHFRETPSTPAFVKGPLRSMAESLLDRAQSVRQIAVDMAADPEVPGLRKSYTGVVAQREVTIVEEEWNSWRLTLAMPDAPDAEGDLEGRFASEGDALAAVLDFLRDGTLHRDLSPVRGRVAAQDPA